MNWLQNIVRPEIWKMAGYSSARMEMTDVSGMIQLDANENPYLPYLTTKSGVGNINRYPHPQPDAVLARLAAIYGVSQKQVLVGRGMDEIMDVLVRVFCIPYKDKIMITPPTYGYYQAIADIAGITVSKVPLSSTDFSLDVAGVIRNTDENTKIIFLCTPNNPTGNVFSLKDIEQIASSLPNVIIAVDEAYIEFADVPSATTIVHKYQNIVVMRTLSKAYAFAGVRVGTLIAIPEIINVARKVLAPYPIPIPVTNLILEALSPFGLELANSRIELLKSERDRVFKHLTSLPGIHVYPSHANFLLFKVSDANAVYKDLLAKGIIIRHRGKDVENTLRFTIGSQEENDLVLRALGVKLDIAKQNERQAILNRKTNETEILAKINLDKQLPVKISTGIGFFDHMLEQLAKHGGFSMELSAKGDTHIDYHHTVEDVAIVIGQALKQALGDKRGINRYGFVLPMDEACAFATLDLSGRGVLIYEAKFKNLLIGDFPVEMVEHFFLSLADQLEAAIHLKVTGDNSHHMVEGLFKAFAKALNQAINRTNNNNVPSTKGTL
ncbi:MAG: histidinol-phosphate aminotransferase [Burkholderiales bacterium]|jgi:histidinol-phosphate aminotransferase/imidazoleglycerol-phosphate dehydratase/histidinol-phosphatase|nr:histidinol-phosphate aminotransferase [Burkholderiales bacterium]